MSASGIDYRILANFASDALYFGLIEPAKIIAWADELIAASDVPTLWMIEVSLADLTDPMALYAALGAVPGTPDKSESVNLLSALVLREWRRGALTIGR